MRARFHRFLALALLCTLVLQAAIVAAAPPGQAPGAAIKLKVATFNPSRGEAPAIPPGLAIAGYAQNQRGYYLVQFRGPVEQAWKDQVAAAGAEVLEYVPEFAFKVRMTPAEARRVQALDTVSWVGIFQPAYKLSPAVIQNGTGLYRVRIERGADVGQATAAIAATGAQVVGRDGAILSVVADPAQVEALAHVLDVAWVENLVLHEKHNESGAGRIMGAGTANTNGYDGSTQTVAVADTGLGDGTAAGAHPDIPVTRTVAIFNWVGAAGGCFSSVEDDGAIDVDSGHGTHVAGSVLSDGADNGLGKGTAPAARLVFQAVENWANVSGFCRNFYGLTDGYYLTGLPDDLRQLFQQAYDAGARVHANSWGAAVAGDYTLDSANTDDFVWTRRDMAITFSAGNSGVDGNGDGVVDNDSIGSPATAKNVITIGASENDRQGSYPCDTTLTYTSHDAYQTNQTCGSMGGNQVNFLGTWGSRYGTSFQAEPLKSDITAGNQEQMAAWSSRGPADDGRLKPDVVAPGTWILSGASGMYQEGYDDPVNPKNGAYQWDGWGMPANVAYKYMGGTSMSNPLAAGAAAVVRDFYQKVHSVGASAALTKATLINSAVDMLDENNDAANEGEVAHDYPIPNMHEGWGRVNVANATDGIHKFVDESTGVGTNGTQSFTFSVNTTKAVKVTLVWSDYASTETASKNLVNDLDLEVTAPSGTLYRGNVFSGGWSQAGGSADRVNNVENVYVQSGATGTWTVTVRGYNVPNGPQLFALVVDGADTDLTASTGGGGGGETPGSMHVGDLDGTKRQINRNNWRATVTVTVHDANEQLVSGAVVAGTWSGGYSGSTSCTTGSAGTCSVETGNVSTRSSSVTFSVSGVSGTLTYDATKNHDPDGDSNGTSIVVTKP